MIKSMTGYGRGTSGDGNITYIVEIKTVNQRFSDYTLKMPRELMALEENIKNTFKKYMERGKADIFINIKSENGGTGEVTADMALIKAYLNEFRRISEESGIPLVPDCKTLLEIPDAFSYTKKEMTPDEIWAVLEKGVEEAGEALRNMRLTEGEKLRKVLLEIIADAEKYFTVIKEKAPLVPAEYRKKLTERLDELENIKADPQRIAAEVAIFADKANIDEEIARLESHFTQFAAILESDGSVGKKLDFLVQEMNREVNTMGSKANDLEITNAVISLKCEIEKLREQIQNVE